MQIVLIQAEIEKAIRNYVNSVVKVAEGVDILIDLKSTRGDTGFTANIDLVEAGAERALAPAPVSTPKAAAPKVNTESSDDLAAKAKAAEAEAKKKAEAAEAAEQAALKQEQERVAAASTETTEAECSAEPPFEPDAKEEAPATTATTTEPEASEQPAAPRKPLFGRTNAPLNA